MDAYILRNAQEVYVRYELLPYEHGSHYHRDYHEPLYHDKLSLRHDEEELHFPLTLHVLQRKGQHLVPNDIP